MYTHATHVGYKQTQRINNYNRSISLNSFVILKSIIDNKLVFFLQFPWKNLVVGNTAVTAAYGYRHIPLVSNHNQVGILYHDGTVVNAFFSLEHLETE